MMAALLVARPLIVRALDLSGPQFSSVFQGATRWHTFIALAIIAAAFGDEGVVLASIAVATMIPISNVVNVVVIAANAGEGRPRFGRLARLVITNPFIVACTIGVVLNVFAIPIWKPIEIMLDLMGQAATGVGLLVVGAGLHLRSAAGAWFAVSLSSGLKLVAMPALAALGCILFGVEGLARTVAFIATGVPTATASYILARQLGGDSDLMAAILTVEVLAATVTLPLILWIVAQ